MMEKTNRVTAIPVKMKKEEEMIIQRHKLENSSALVSKWRLKHPIRRSRKPLAQRKKTKPHIKHNPITNDIDVQN